MSWRLGQVHGVDYRNAWPTHASERPQRKATALTVQTIAKLRPPLT
jgi:hypothetical protein